MEPRLSSRGNNRPEFVKITKSMLQWSHGSQAVEIVSYWFERLTQYELQWSHGSQAVEIRLWDANKIYRGKRFNGATALKPWKFLSCQVVVMQFLSFNGATALKPWK